MYDYVAGKADWAAAGLTVEGANTSLTRIAALAHEPPTCGLDDEVPPLGDAAVCVVIDARRLVIGLVRGSDLSEGQRPIARDVMREGPSTYRPNVSADELAPKLDDDHPPWVVVTTSEGILVGVAAAADVRAAARPS